MDAALRELYERAAPRAPSTAFAAVGGYGRGALVPGSDIDILLLHDGSAPDEVAALAETLLYPLWDAGFAVGHAVRTPKETSALAEARLDSTTAMLDARFLAGDRSLFDEASSSVVAQVREDPEAFTEKLREAALRRRDRYGSTAYLLEPDLKDGGGALRDIHAFGWMERAIARSLEEAGLIRPRERLDLEEAEEFLTRVRSALHIETGKRADKLFLDNQPSIARAMGFTDEPRLIAEDGLMRALFEHARQVDFLVERVLLSPVAVDSPAVVPVDAADAMAIFALAAEEGRTPTPTELDAVELIELPQIVVWNDEVRHAFLRILRAPKGWTGLEALDRAGLLVRFIPEWDQVRCRPQRDPYHRFTVDMHLLTAVRGMRESLDAVVDPVQEEAARQIDDRDGVLLGALFHDIGKNGEGAHLQVGTRLARSALGRMALRDSTRELAQFMVEHHLLLPDTATRRDLTDDDLILDVAAQVGTPERLAALYLLSDADALATGPAASTEWRKTLIRELVAKVQRALERGEMGEEVAERLSGRVNRLRELLPDANADEVDRFVLRMPRGYFLAVEPSRVARHYGTVAPAIGQRDVRTTSWPGMRPGSFELLVVAADRPGLLSWIAGCLALEGLSILTANVFTTEDGVAVDLFEVAGIFEAEVREDTWRGFRTALRRAIEGRISLEYHVMEKRKHYPTQKRLVPVSVTIDNEASDFFTVIEVGAADRIGLLYDITRTLSELQLDVHLAKIATYADRVIDAFYVRDVLGQKVTDPQQVQAIEGAMATRLG